MCLKKKIAGIIEVEEIHDVIDVGTTMPVRCRLENGMNVIVKYMKNPFGQIVLINELIGSCIADLVGVNNPEYGICNLSEEVIINSNCNEEIDLRNAGLAFYTKEYSSTIPPSMSMLSLVENKETEKIILFDHIVNNCDRHKGNLIIDISKMAKLYVIDNSHIITEGINSFLEREITDEAVYSNRVLLNNKDIYDLLCSSVGYREDILLLEAQKIKENITPNVLKEIKNLIPDVWSESVGKEMIEMIFAILNRRILAICELSNMIIEERRK